MAEHLSANPTLIKKRAALVNAQVTRCVSFNDKPAANSQGELAVATSGSHHLRRRSNV